MDSWPTDYRTNVTPSGQGKRRNVKEAVSLHDYLDVRLGSLNAVTLFEKDHHRFEWTSALKNTLHKSVDRRCSTLIFPRTRPPRLCIPQTTVLQRAEQGANFLRTYLPDIDVPAELIRDEISRDAENWKKYRPFDPYVGGLLEHIACNATTGVLAFPMGELNRDLNLSSIRYLERHKASLHPNASPVRSFKTPIQQIESSRYIPDRPQTNSYLAVRTFEMTSVMKVTFKQSAQVAELGSIAHADVGHRAIVDIKLTPQPPAALVITDNGALYKLNIADGQKVVSILGPATDAELTEDAFWRIALGENGESCFLASSKCVKLHDFRSKSAFDLFTIPRQQDVLTSIDHGGDNIVRLCSTRDIFWMDKRFPNKPLLGYQHDRQYDRSLELRTLTHLTLLTSRHNALVTVYDVSRSAGCPAHMNSIPYCLLPNEVVVTQSSGSAFLQHPQYSNEIFGLVRLSDEGSLHCIDLAVPGYGGDNVVNTSWSVEVKELALQGQNEYPDVGPLGAQDSSETDFRLPYDAIFRAYAEEQASAEELNRAAVHNLLDQIPDFWQNSEAPVEHMLTMFDAVFWSGPQPPQASRADFLTQSIINSKRGYRALLQDRLSAQSLMKDASWHHDIKSTVKRLGVDVMGDVRSCAEALHKYDLRKDPERDAQSYEWEKSAREQLALDLTLSSDVFSRQPFMAFPNGSTELEAMTKTLSLANEHPSVEFGYLHPVAKSGADQTRITATEDETGSFNGIEALLKGWVIGQILDVGEPDRTTLSDSSAPDGRARETNTSQGLQSPPSQRPPLVVASTVVPSSQAEGPMRGFRVEQSRVPGLPPRGFGLQSQPMPVASEPAGSSQDYVTSTQILPGAYGGRASFGKQKMAKKRLGGF